MDGRVDWNRMRVCAQIGARISGLVDWVGGGLEAGDNGEPEILGAHLIVRLTDLDVVSCLAFQIVIVGHNHNPVPCQVAVNFQ